MEPVNNCNINYIEIYLETWLSKNDFKKSKIAD